MSDDLKQEISTVSNQSELDQVLGLFNLTFKKASMQRALALSDLQDMVIDQARKRIEENADEFSNTDLLNYMNSINNALQKIDKESDGKVPTIAVQNNTIYELSRDSRERVKEYLKEIMAEHDIIVEERPGKIDGVSD